LLVTSTVLKHVVALGGDAEWNGSCYTPSLIVEGPSTGRQTKNNLCPPALTQRLSQWLRPRRASAIAEACLRFGRGTIRRFAQSGAGWFGHGECRHPTCYQWLVLPAVGLSFAARWLTAERWHQKRAVAVFLTSAAMPINLSGVALVKLVTIIALFRLTGAADQLCMWSCLGSTAGSTSPTTGVK